MKTWTLVMTVALVACGGSGSNNDAGPGGDAGMMPIDGGMMTADAGPSCFENPTTHVEIVNACTTATGIEKTPVLPLLLADGGLPALP